MSLFDIFRKDSLAKKLPKMSGKTIKEQGPNISPMQNLIAVLRSKDSVNDLMKDLNKIKLDDPASPNPDDNV